MNYELNNNISAYFSQSTETLYRFLVQNLYGSNKSPFLKRVVLVPSPLMKTWVIKEMADALGISMGVELFLQEQGLRKIADYLGMSSPNIVPTVDQLAFAFQLLIPKLCNDYPFLQTYLKDSHQKRLLSLAAEMAELFVDYGTFGKNLLEEWKQHPDKHWQAALWNLLCSEYPQWGTPFQLYNSPVKKPKFSFEIHLFAISFLPALVVRFLESLPVPVHFYHLSPTQTFWEDTLTSSQRRYLCKIWEEKGVSEAQLEDLNHYLRETHPLLANWGKLGRMMVKQLPSDLKNYEELYPLPEKIFEESEWCDLTYPETIPVKGANLTLLSRLQADLVTMRPIPEELTPCGYDRTIQVHQTACKRREIEEIYNIIIGIIGKHSTDEHPITPEDVVVMAPEIIDYAPYIQAYFERDESVLDYRLMDIALPTHDPCIRAFRKILSLIRSRWESATLKDLLHLELFQKKIGLDGEGVIRLQRWIEDNEVVWGMNSKHHAESLTQSHCPEGIEVHQGTWEDFFEKTLRGLVTVHDDTIAISENDILPYSKIDLNDAELLGKWIEALKELYDELKIIESTETTLLEWSQLLESLCNKFLEELSGQMEHIFHSFRQLAIPFSHQLFSFDSVLEWFEGIFQKEKTSYREQHINSIRFCSLLPMRAIPAKVVILCGMSDGAFPRTQIETSQNKMKEAKESDPKPKKVDFDRYLMLETILSTRQYLVFTYSASEQDQGPSLIINEFLDLLDRYYVDEDKPISSKIFFKHPFRRYDPYYFEGNPHVNYSPKAYLEALAALKKEKRSINAFIQEFEMHPTEEITESELSIPLSDLETLARDPLGFYYKKTLGITLKEDDIVKTERYLSLSSISGAMIPRKALKGELSNEILLSKKKGELPEGVFEELAKRTLTIKSQSLKANLQKVGTCSEALYDYTFEHLVFHPNNLPRIILSGTIENITPEGLVLHREGKPEDRYRFLPRILLFHFLINEGLIQAKPRLIFSESGKTIDLTHPNPKEQIESYLCYWNQAKQNPSPLLPNWIKFLLNNDVQGLETLLNNTFVTVFNSYEKANKNFDIAHLMNSPWTDLSRRLYDSFV
jgi:exodeoxyribonuclease V gamma subunit